MELLNDMRSRDCGATGMIAYGGLIKVSTSLDSMYSIMCLMIYIQAVKCFEGY